jgi:hypothetical protein
VAIDDVTQADGAGDQSKETDAPAQPDEIEKLQTPEAETPEAKPPEAPRYGPEPEAEPVKPATATPEPEQDITAPDEPAPTAASPAPARQGNTFLPMVLGGIIAGAIGFGVAQFAVLDPADDGVATQLRTELDAQQERIAAIESAEPVAAEMPAVDLGQIETQLDDIVARLTALEERPAPVVPEGVNAEAYAAELEALKSSVDTQRSEIEELLSNARTVEQATADASRTASAQTAIAKIVSAIDSGQPFADALADLQALDLGELDPALGAVADEGVATLSVLQAEFPDRARQALATARADSAGDGRQGFGGFLTRSLGARSVTPREGDDPDAVLSRAEAAINSGDLNAALTELDSLPEGAQAAIADWRAAADARVDARAAADALAQRLTAD